MAASEVAAERPFPRAIKDRPPPPLLYYNTPPPTGLKERRWLVATIPPLLFIPSFSPSSSLRFSSPSQAFPSIRIPLSYDRNESKEGLQFNAGPSLWHPIPLSRHPSSFFRPRQRVMLSIPAKQSVCRRSLVLTSRCSLASAAAAAVLLRGAGGGRRVQGDVRGRQQVGGRGGPLAVRCHGGQRRRQGQGGGRSRRMDDLVVVVVLDDAAHGEKGVLAGEAAVGVAADAVASVGIVAAVGKETDAP